MVWLLAGYPADMEKLLAMDPGLPERFPEANRFLFDDMTEEDLHPIMMQVGGSRFCCFPRKQLSECCIALRNFIVPPPVLSVMFWFVYAPLLTAIFTGVCAVPEDGLRAAKCKTGYSWF